MLAVSRHGSSRPLSAKIREMIHEDLQMGKSHGSSDNSLLNGAPSPIKDSESVQRLFDFVEPDAASEAAVAQGAEESKLEK